MTSKHTPGPWFVEGPPENEHACFHEGNRFAVVHTVEGVSPDEPMSPTIAEVWPADNGQDYADAQLIAAAPELLDALRGLVSVRYRASGMAEEAARVWARAEKLLGSLEHL